MNKFYDKISGSTDEQSFTMLRPVHKNKYNTICVHNKYM